METVLHTFFFLLYPSVTHKPEPSPVWFRVFDPDANFTGRSSELLRLKYASTKPPHIIVVSGLGGIGKTQLVRKYVDENRSFYKNVVWINSQESELIEEAFTTLATNSLEISTHDIEMREKDFKAIVEEVLRKLSKSPTLIVFDNADKEENAQFIPFVLRTATSGYKPHIVITSRIQEWSHDISLMKLDVFTTEDAVQYVTKTLLDPENFYKDSLDDKKALVEKLQNFPLALRQATAHLNYQREDGSFYIADYLHEYDTSNELLNSNIFKTNALNTYEETTFTTWRVTLAAINKFKGVGGLAHKILRIIAFFEPENIRRDIFFNLKLPVGLDKIDFEKEVRSAVRLLANYSMVDSRNGRSVLSIHRLVQQVTKIEMENESLTETILRECLRLISEMKEQKTFREIHEHGVAVYLSAIKFNELVKEFDFFPHMILGSLFNCIKYSQAKNFGDEILHQLTTILGDDHPETIASKKLIAHSYRELGKHSKALQIYQEILEKRIEVSGQDHPETVDSKADIGYTYHKLGEHSDALRTYQEVLEKSKEIYGEDHQETLAIRANIAYSLRELGDHRKALEMYEEVFDKQRKIFGEDHPITLTIKSNVAHSYLKLDENSEALRIYQEVFEKRNDILGNDHPETLAGQAKVAHSYLKLGEHNKALQIYEEVFEKRKKILGEDHPDTLTTKDDIADSLHKLGKCSEALQMFHEVLEKRMKIFGEEHRATLASKAHIAFLSHENDSKMEMSVGQCREKDDSNN